MRQSPEVQQLRTIRSRKLALAGAAAPRRPSASPAIGEIGRANVPLMRPFTS